MRSFASLRTTQGASRRTLLLLLPLMIGANAAAQSTWYAVRGPDHAFIVDMPGEPIYKVIDTRSPAGTAFAYHSYSLAYGRMSVVAQTAMLSADIDVRQPRTYLQSVLDDRAQRLAGGKWTSIVWRDVQGAPGADSVGSKRTRTQARPGTSSAARRPRLTGTEPR